MISDAQPDEHDIDEVDDASQEEAEIVLGTLGSQHVAIQESGGDYDCDGPAQTECEPGEQGHECHYDAQDAKCCRLVKPDGNDAFAHQTVIVYITDVIDEEHTH